MPVYLYRNLTTDETFELEQRITAPALTQHPETGDPVKRLIQPVGIAFKGSGFYVTDSRSSSSKTNGKPDAKAEGGPAKTDTPSKPGEGKASESKVGESKAGESKPRESKAESKSNPG